MSASRERKKRVEQTAVEQPVAKKKKLSEGWIFTISIVLVLAIAAGVLLVRNYKQSHDVILTVGSHEVDGEEFSYFYCSLVNNLYSYASYYGIDTEASLEDQKVSSTGAYMAYALSGMDVSYLDDKTTDDSSYYDVTWAELLTDAAMRNAASAYSVYQAATEAGYTLDEEALAEIEEAIESIKTYAATYGVSVDEYIESAFGRDCNEAGYRQYLTVTEVASHYPYTLEYSDAELAARYEQAPEEFDTVAFYYYTVSASTVDTDSAEDETEDAETDELAKAAANAMAENFDVTDDDVKIYADYTREYVESYLSIDKEVIDWLFDEAEEGEVKLFAIEPEADEESEDADEGETTYVVAKFLSREDYNAYNYITITVEDDAEDVELEEGELSSAEMVAKIKAALEEDGSEENFRAQVLVSIGHEEEEDSDHDHSEEGVTEDASRYSLANASKELFQWLAVDGAEVGTWKMVELDGSTVFYFFLGQGESYRDLCVENTLLNEWYTELTEAAIANCGFDRKAALRINRIGYFND